MILDALAGIGAVAVLLFAVVGVYTLAWIVAGGGL